MLNFIAIMGRLTSDPDLRHTGAGIPVASFTLAVERDIQSKDGKNREVDFIDCIAWRQTGEFISKYFIKGRMMVVVGRLQISNWVDKEGNKRRNAQVVVDSVYFGDSKRINEGQRSTTHPSFPSPAANPETHPSFTVPAGSDFALLEDDDAQLPF